MAQHRASASVGHCPIFDDDDVPTLGSQFETWRRSPFNFTASREIVKANPLPTIHMSLPNGVAVLSEDDVLVAMHRRAATYVDRLLRGAKVSDLPVQFPTKYELIVNLKAAKAIRLTIPEAFLLRADEIVE
jgi:hypothetical protein